MSSTTDRRGELGQALVVFAGALVGLLLAAALATDVGIIMLERRHQQNAADAAALAGARYLPDTSLARTKAREVATDNDFTQGVNSAAVTVGATSTRIQVRITRNLPSFFASLAGHPSWDVSALAVAVSLTDQPPFAALTALNPHECEALKITGGGIISSWGDVQVNSDCDRYALLISGNGNLQLQHDGLACWVVGDEPGSDIGGNGQGSFCDPPQAGVPIDFPVSGMPSDENPPTPPLQVGGTAKSIPNGCPGSATPATDAAPATCQFNASYGDTTWRLYPGYYPGGIKLQGGTFYLEPDIYHLAGGGFTVTSNGTSATSVAPGGTTLGGGVLFFNTTHAIANSGPFDVGGNGGTFNFHPFGGFDENCSGESGGWNRYLVFQDPAVTNELSINGGSNAVEARGLIYAPTANVKINGGTGSLTIDAIVADTFMVNGNGGTINVMYDNCALPTYTGYGLVI